MSGWDEGQVYYSRQFEGDEERDAALVTRHKTQRLLREFLQTFHDDSVAGGDFIYRESLRRNRKYLQVDLSDLRGKAADLEAQLRRNPADCLPLLEAAAAEVSAEVLRAKVMGEDGEMEEPAREDVQVMLSTQENPMSIRHLS
eukprot:SM006647S20282  [mRNA]  locus=s6647:100:760:+ [translate_table: standard]